ncbi:glycoside hydrolase family 15 protein [Crocosphaera sp. XPORK-15E]|uniref:glycoside hydrolase family 15 protein n=1 Tax=Crocosphaera sp. XPORK-15E TaxID=3110247 RepID=UPI002B20EEA7|nr:glycoside hydrolase family 15 protein [Crocosphaera sp. XPORK-15E]MEA5537265.1 glycoside hydrolase family 15 protein [Crocosphaera sp. XPORK-15E]
MLILHNQNLLDLMRCQYSLEDIQGITRFLESQKTLSFSPLENGLFPAAAVVAKTAYTGYSNVWVRDNIYLAYTHYFCHKSEIAIKTIKTLIKYFQKHQNRFQDIIDGKVNKNEIMKRPHIRFNGETLEEIDQEWSHAQNDALGYFLWFTCKLIREKILIIKPNELEILALFPFYFEAISYWEDEDSGHWEEDRKIEASSIGVVVAALTELKLLVLETSDQVYCQNKNNIVSLELLDKLINKGQETLNKILPDECIQDPPQTRKYDAALLFLIYPLQLIEGEMAEKIVNNVINNLQGDYGIKRYLGDSFWCRDYQEIPEVIRTTISSEREQWFKDNNRELRLREEAQWCIFDPIISAIFGIKFQQTNQPEYLEKQTYYLNRSLGQLTPSDSQFGGLKCPELYYLKQGVYFPGDATPLLWTQANLKVALKMMEKSLSMDN